MLNRKLVRVSLGLFVGFVTLCSEHGVRHPDAQGL